MSKFNREERVAAARKFHKERAKQAEVHAQFLEMQALVAQGADLTEFVEREHAKKAKADRARAKAAKKAQPKG